MLILRWCISSMLPWAFQISEVTRKYFWVEVFENTGKSFLAFLAAGVGFCQSLAAHSPIRSTSLHLTLSTLGKCTLSLLHIGLWGKKNKKWCEFTEEVVLMGSLNMKKTTKSYLLFFAFIRYLIVFDISNFSRGWARLPKQKNFWKSSKKFQKFIGFGGATRP